MLILYLTSNHRPIPMAILVAVLGLELALGLGLKNFHPSFPNHLANLAMALRIASLVSSLVVPLEMITLATG